MTQTVEVNLIDVLNRLESKIDNINEKLTKVEIDVEKLKSQNEQIVKRLDNVENRLNTMTIGFLSIVGILVTGLLGIIGKLTFFPNP
jgi:predicted nuclease with TOPRIM domain